MAWLKLDDGFADHPKVLEAGPMAGWLHVCGMLYCARMLTDGFIPSGQVRKLADMDGAQELAQRLVDAGLWEAADGGYQIHDWADSLLQPTPRQRSDMRRQWEAMAGRVRPVVFELDNYTCQICGTADANFEVDHIIPIALGGTNDMGNLQTLCRACNLRKGGR